MDAVGAGLLEIVGLSRRFSSSASSRESWCLSVMASQTSSCRESLFMMMITSILVISASEIFALFLDVREGFGDVVLEVLVNLLDALNVLLSARQAIVDPQDDGFQLRLEDIHRAVDGIHLVHNGLFNFLVVRALALHIRHELLVDDVHDLVFVEEVGEASRTNLVTSS